MSHPIESLAFPSYLASDVTALIPALSLGQSHSPHQNRYEVFVQGQRIEIPSRVYYQSNNVLNFSTHADIQGHIALCLGTRHDDGYIRQKCLKRLVSIEQPWVAPFVTLLVGEYVVQIIQDIENALPNLNSKIYADFLAENPKLLGTIGRRVTSYWNEYYRAQYPSINDYPGYRVVTALGTLSAL